MPSRATTTRTRTTSSLCATSSDEQHGDNTTHVTSANASGVLANIANAAIPTDDKGDATAKNAAAKHVNTADADDGDTVML